MPGARFPVLLASQGGCLCCPSADARWCIGSIGRGGSVGRGVVVFGRFSMEKLWNLTESVHFVALSALHGPCSSLPLPSNQSILSELQ
jgi:hypothetical protein